MPGGVGGGSCEASPYPDFLFKCPRWSIMTVPPHCGVMGAILPDLEGGGIKRKLLVHDRNACVGEGVSPCHSLGNPLHRSHSPGQRGGLEQWRAAGRRGGG
jgi:hypothetical protein